MGATAVLAQFAAELTIDQIPPEARSLAGEHVLDCLGVALAASAEMPGQITADLTREGGGTPESRLVGSGVLTSAGQAAWANGSLAHLLDFDDTGFSHLTACILPAALALGERL